MKTILRILLLVTIVISCGILINAKKFRKVPNHTTTFTDSSSQNIYKIHALKIPKRLFFARERVPLQKLDVKERIDRELLINTYWQSNGLLLFKRAHKYFPIIEPILRKYKIPNDFKYLAVAESGLLNITSPKGAKGFWQLLKKTAQEYGLEVNNNVDERYNIEKSTEAACQYILKSKTLFGSWTLAAAAYNAGNKGISTKMEEQKIANYYDLLVGDETSRYIPRIVAIKEILTHPKKYGFYFDKDDLYQLQPVKIYTVDTVISNIALFAKKFNTNYKTLKINNPWLRENKLNNDFHKTYYLKIPK